MSNTHEKLLNTSADKAEDFSQAMDRLFALRMMIPAVVEDAGPEGRQDTLQCGIGSFLDDIYAEMSAISKDHWNLIHSHRKTLVEQGKIEQSHMLTVSADPAKATGTNG